VSRLPSWTGAGRDNGVAPARPDHLGDFTLSPRVVWITLLARLQHRTALALCPYAQRWTQLHPDYRGTARIPLPGERTAVGALRLAAQSSWTLTARGAAAASPAAAGR